MSFFSRLRSTAKKFFTKTTRAEPSGRGGGGGFTQRQPIEIEIPQEFEEELTYPEDYGRDVEVPIYQQEDVEVVERYHIPGPDPMRLSSGDLLSTAAFYGVTDQEYAEISDMVDIAYNDPASTADERREALIGIQEAMSMVHDRATEDSDFDWDAWRAEVYGEKQ